MVRHQTAHRIQNPTRLHPKNIHRNRRQKEITNGLVSEDRQVPIPKTKTEIESRVEVFRQTSDVVNHLIKTIIAKVA